MAETLAEALHRLGRVGFARRFEPAGDAFRCTSCEETFLPEALLVEDVVDVVGGVGGGGDATGARTTLYALRCTGCGAKGVWIVTDERPEDHALLRRLGSSQAHDHDPGHDHGHDPGRDHDDDPGSSGPVFGT